MAKPILILTVPNEWTQMASGLSKATEGVTEDFHVLIIASMKAEDISWEVIYPTPPK